MPVLENSDPDDLVNSLQKFGTTRDTTALFKEVELEQALKEQQKQPKAEPSILDLSRECLYSACFTGLQKPVTAVAEIADKVLETNGVHAGIADKVTKMDAPEAGTGSRKDAQLVGGALGMIVPFLLTKSALSRSGLSVTAKAEASALASGKFLSSGAAKTALIADSAITGFTSEALFTPVGKTAEFWEARGKNGLSGAATFATLTAAGLATRSVVAPTLDQLSGAKRVLGDFATGATAGIPAGLVSANADSLLNEGKFADSNAAIDRAQTMAFTGGFLSIIPAFVTRYRISSAIEQGAKIEATIRSAQSESLRRILQRIPLEEPRGKTFSLSPQDAAKIRFGQHLDAKVFQAPRS